RGTAHAGAVEAQERREPARARLFFCDYRADMRNLSRESRIEGVRGLQVIHAAIVRRFPGSKGSQDKHVARDLRQVWKERARENECAGILPEVGIGRIPRTV